MEQMNLDDWQKEQSTNLNLVEMDALITEYKKAREIYDSAKEEASAKYKIVDELEAQVINVLKAANKKSYKVDGIGNAVIKHKYVVTTPKDGVSKWGVLKYIEEKYGQDVRDSYISVNHASLNSFYNQEKEIHVNEPGFNIPGLGLPTLQESLSFTKAK